MRKVIQVEERPKFLISLPLSFQHLFAMFGASVLVPSLFGINPAIVLFMNGIGTLLFIFVTKGKSPAFLGSSFAYISPVFLILARPELGYKYALGGFVISGLLFCLFALVVKLFGVKWINVLLPPAAMGPVVALIGLELSGEAAKMSGLILQPGYETLDAKVIAVFLITLLTAVIGSVTFKRFFALIPILIAIVTGYIASFALGLVNTDGISTTSVFEIPHFQFPAFDLGAIMIILPVTLVVLSEHIGHQLVTGKIIDRDLIKDPGLHRSILGDGLSTVISGMLGSIPTTTYGENIGVMAVTKVYSVWIIGGAAIISIIVSFFGGVSAIIMSIPGPVMGGVSFLLYGMIAASGIRLIVDAKVDYSRSRNLALTSVTFVTGLSGAYVNLGVTQLKGMALATIVAMLLSLAFYALDKFKLTTD